MMQNFHVGAAPSRIPTMSDRQSIENEFQKETKYVAKQLMVPPHFPDLLPCDFCYSPK